MQVCELCQKVKLGQIADRFYMHEASFQWLEKKSESRRYGFGLRIVSATSTFPVSDQWIKKYTDNEIRDVN
jgi:hypothetical protein